MLHLDISSIVTRYTYIKIYSEHTGAHIVETFNIQIQFINSQKTRN